MDKFECTSCGLCCKKIGKILKYGAPFDYLKKATREFPYKANEDGSCEKLDKDNKCSVYDDRPLLCDISRLGDEPYMPMSKEVWYEMNYKGCETLQMEIK
jgi:Fe-S-cluster containining protein